MNVKVKANAKDGTLELNKTAKALMEIAGIEVYSDKSKGEVKGMMELLDEVKEKWGSLREDEQLGLAEAIAGKLIFRECIHIWNEIKGY